MAPPGLVDEYLTLGLRLGRHIDGLVDAYYGPADRSALVGAEPVHPPEQLVAEARALLAAIDAGGPLDPAARRLRTRGRFGPGPTALAPGPGRRPADHGAQGGR